MGQQWKCIGAHILISLDLLKRKDLVDVKYRRFGKIFEYLMYFDVKNSEDINTILTIARKERKYMKNMLSDGKLVISFYAPSKYVDLLTAISHADYPAFNNLLDTKKPGYSFEQSGFFLFIHFHDLIFEIVSLFFRIVILFYCIMIRSHFKPGSLSFCPTFVSSWCNYNIILITLISLKR